MRWSTLFVTLVVVFAVGCGGGGGAGDGAPRAGSPAGYQALASLDRFALSNGRVAAVWSSTERKLIGLRERIYRTRAPGVPVPELCREVMFGFRRDGASKWLRDVPVLDRGYLEGSGIFRTVQRAAGFRFETYAFAPYTPEIDGLVLALRVVNEGGRASDCALFLAADLALGGEGDATREWAFHDAAGAFVMEGRSGGGRRVLYQALGGLDHWAIAQAGGGDDPRVVVAQGAHLPDRRWPFNADDVVCGLERKIADGGVFEAGSEAWWGVLLALGTDGDEARLRADAASFVSGLGVAALLQRERDGWARWHAAERIPAALSSAERRCFQQQTAFLRMGQARERGPGDGQIVASLPPGKWNICWPRDAAYAIVALARSGHLSEAQAALRFLLRAGPGRYTGYVGRPYRISVARYFGNGEEESDDNGNGPNIEFDNFGLVLWAIGETIRYGADFGLVRSHWAVIRDEIAEVLVSLIEPNGLLRADSSIWERHLRAAPGSPDGARQFAYSAIMAIVGLERAAVLAGRMGDQTSERRWRDAALRIRGAIERELLFPDGVLAGSLEERALGIDYAMDASVVEAINHGVLAPGSSAARATLRAFDTWLRVWPVRSPGYLRVDDARHYGPENWYDRQEWVVIDLRVASAKALVGERAGARVLFDWVSAQAERNAWVIPELYDERSSAYAGEYPMIGFGAGAWVIGAFDLAGR